MRRWLRIVLILSLVLFVALGCVNIPGRGTERPVPQAPILYATDGNAPFINVFVVERASGYLVPVSVRRQLDGPSPVGQAVKLLNGAPALTAYRTLGAREAHIRSVSLHNGVLDIEMAASFQAWVLRNEAEERAFIGAVALTFTTFSDVESVRFKIEGRSLQGYVGGFNLGNPIMRPTLINSPQSARPHAVIYVRMKDTDLLVPITRSVPERDPLVAVQALFDFKPVDNLVSPLPVGIKLRNLTVENGVAVVDLDKGAVTLFLRGAFYEQIVVDALVHTLLEFAEIRQVQFLVDGRVLGPLSANIDLSGPVRRTPINAVVLP